MFWTIAKNHLRLMARERVLWAGVLLIVSTSAYSFGFARWQLARARRAEVDFLHRAGEAAARNQQLAAAIEGRITAGKEKEIIPPPFGSRHPAYAGTWSQQPALLPSSPMKWLAVGQSDIYVTAFAGPELDEVPALGNPMKLLRGHLDLAFIAVYLVPLVLIALSFDLVSSERDSGVLQLAVAQGAPPGTIVLAKWTSVSAVVVVTTTASFAIGVFFSGVVQGTAARAAVAGIAILAYVLFWAAVALGVNALGRSASESLLMLTGLWLVFTVLLPFAIDRIVVEARPVPPISTLLDADRAAPGTIPAANRKLLAVFLRRHPEIQEEGLSDLGRLYLNRAVRRAALEELQNERREAWEGALREQETLARRLALWTPAATLTSSLVQLAGTGRERYLDFIEQKRSFEDQYDAFFLPRRLALPNSIFHAADYSRIPTMTYREETPRTVLRRSAPSLLELGATTALAGIAAMVLFKRKTKNAE
jgi:ABC-2 type transport system permease protein